jgi:hypothetical protein
MKKVITVVVLILTFFQTTNTQAQDFLKGNDISAVKVDNLSEVTIGKQ